MARYFSGTRSEFLTLEAASKRDLTWDVFVSHTTEDDDVAEEVAECIRSFGLSAWVDSDHLDSKHDGPSMASIIQGVIRRSYCLLAVVTSATNESWWVPFEIGVASDRKRYLSTFGDPRVLLPSFLAAWPRVRDHAELHLWCSEVKKKKATHRPIIHESYVEVASAQRSSYASDMRAMARRFPGLRWGVGLAWRS